MDCQEFRLRYSDYRDGHDPALAADVDDHLEVCPQCAAYDRAVREGIEILRGTSVLPSPEFQARLEARLAGDEAVPEPLPPRVSSWAATTAVALLILLIGLTVQEISVLPEPVAAESEPPLVLVQPRLLPGIPFVAFERAN